MEAEQLLLCVCVVAALLPCVVSVQPNFLLLFPDQLRFDWTPDNPVLAPLLSMPIYASLRAKGTHFSHAFVPSPLCAPSRACLAAAKEYDEAGVPDNFSNDYPINQTTFYTLMRQAGYSVMTSGKDDLTKATGPSINGSFHAKALGFSQWARCDGKQDAAGSAPHDPYGAWCANHSEVVRGKNMTFWQIYNNDMQSCAHASGTGGGYDCELPSPLPQAAYEDDWVAQNAVALLAQARAPWFLQVSFPGPHPPFVVTSAMMNSTQTLTFPLAVDNTIAGARVQQTLRRAYAAELINLDRLFGTVLAAIPPAQLQNTFIFVASDHGEMLGDHDDWGKTMPWQGSVSVPLVVTGPGLPAGATIADPVGTMDIAGTVLDFAGVSPAPGMTTRSLRPLLQPVPAPSAYRAFVSSGLAAWRAVIQTRPDGTRLKLVCCRSACPGQPGSPARGFVGDSGEDEGSYPGVLVGRNSTEAMAGPTLLLFDIDADPFDMHNLAPTRPTALKDMLLLLPAGWCGR